MPKKYCKVCGKELERHNKKGYCIKHRPAYIRTPEIKAKISASRRGIEPWNKGKQIPDHSTKLKEWWAEHPEQKEKQRQRGIELSQDKAYLEKLSMLLSGDKNPNWRGGIAHTKYKGFYKKLKDKIRARDNYTCQLCGKTEKELGYTLSVNHINFDKEDNREENLNALCKRCNSYVNFDREKWTKWFQIKIASIYGNGGKKEDGGIARSVD